METVIGAAISTVGAVVICIITQIVLANRQTDSLRADTKEQTTLINGKINVIDVKMEALTAKVEKHNQLVERVYKLEERTEVQGEKIRSANRRIDDLEHGKGT